MKKRKKIVISLVVCFGVVILIALSVALFIEKVHMLMDEPPIYNTEAEFVESKDFIFVAKVKEEAKTKYNKDSSIPLTYYDIEVIEYLKGQGDKNEVLCFYGGRNYLNTYTYYENNNIIPEKNNIYLFFTKRSSGNSEYVESNTFVITNNAQKIELKDYNESKSLSEQNENINLTVQRFKNIINKEVKKFPSNLPSQLTDEELVARFDNVFIAQVTQYFYSYPVQCGEGSDIPSVCVEFHTLQNIKGSTQGEKLWLCGVDYWNEETDGIYFPKQNEVFLVFANKNEKENINHPQVESSNYVVLMNYQMIKLKDYDSSKDYKNQKEAILAILNKYENLMK